MTVADLLVGAVSGPLGIYFTYEMEHARHGFSWRVFSILTLSTLFSGLFLLNLSLRAVVSNFRESGDRAENSNFFLFAQKNPFGELISKLIFKMSSEFLFWQKNGKFEIGLNGPPV